VQEQTMVPQPKAGGTIFVDVRTVEEWNNDGHANCSINIPLDQLEARMGELKKDQKVVLVCRSGKRAGTAKELLEGAGFTQVENSGAWQNITCQ
jgi:rhodanese-related sulfurtransferase